MRLFVGNLSYATTEADLRAYFGTVAPPSQVVLKLQQDLDRSGYSLRLSLETAP